MSKYYKAEDVIRKRAEDLADTSYWEYGNPKNVDEWIEVAEMEFKDLPTIEVSEDCISREWLLNYTHAEDVGTPDEMWKPAREWVNAIKSAPSVIPKWCIGEVDCPYVIDQDCGLQKCSGELSMEEQYQNCPLRRKG